MVEMVRIQMGKNGLTNEFLDNLKHLFIKTTSIRISLLKSATRDRQEAEKIAERIVSNLGNNYSCKKIGYTLVVRKWRRDRTLNNLKGGIK